MTERETGTSALAGPLVNARATSAGVAPCAPIPGRRRTACGIRRRASATAPRIGGPPTSPPPNRPPAREAALADEPGSPLVHELGDLLPDAPPVGEHEVLNVSAARVR